MAGGFSVDLAALDAAGHGVSSLIDDLDDHKVSDLACDTASVGHDELATSLSSFCQRWQIGVASLSKDGRYLASGLTGSARSYQAIEDQLTTTFQHVSGS